MARLLYLLVSASATSAPSEPTTWDVVVSDTASICCVSLRLITIESPCTVPEKVKIQIKPWTIHLVVCMLSCPDSRLYQLWSSSRWFHGKWTAPNNSLSSNSIVWSSACDVVSYVTITLVTVHEKMLGINAFPIYAQQRALFPCKDPCLVNCSTHTYLWPQWKVADNLKRQWFWVVYFGIRD